MANSTNISKTKFLADLCSSETEIGICMKCAGIDMNLQNIRRAIQFKISDYIMLPDYFQ